MAAEAAPDRLTSPRSARAPLTRRRVESVLSRSAAAFGVLFYVQTLPVAVQQTSHGHEPRQWTYAFALMLLLALAATCVSAVAQRWVAWSSSAFAVIYLVALVTWPLVNLTPLESADGTHWLYFLLTVSTALAALAWPVRIAAAYLVVVAAAYGIAGFVTSGGATTQQQQILEAVYSIMLGGAILVIMTILRLAASEVDRAQAAALESYAEAVRQHATEVERVQVDSIVHDSVLTTLLSAARATSPEAKALAARMASNAIGFLRQAALIGPIDGTSVAIAAVGTAVAASAETVGVPFDVRVGELSALGMPVAAAEAMQAAATQAMVNSAQHAGESAHRWVDIRGSGPLGVVVEIGDDGEGFLLDEVTTERIGLRVSVLERLENAGGETQIDTQPGEGTIVTLRWPARGGLA
jgi:signal transduction histidine kinase